MYGLKKIFTIKGVLGLASIALVYKYLNFEGVEKYIIAMTLSLMFLYMARKKEWPVELFLCAGLPAIVYLLIGSVNGVLHGTYQMSSVKMFLYWLLPLIFSFALAIYYEKDMEYLIDVQLICSCLYYGIPCGKWLLRGICWESTYAFAFGAFAIYYAYKRKWIFCALSLLFLYFADKRIASVAVLLALILMLFLWLFENNEKLVYTIWVAVIGGLFAYLYLIYSGIMEYFCWGFDINTNGRVEMYSRVAETYNFSPFFLGEGLGVVETLMESYAVSAFSNLHNDILKFYIELGFLGLLIFLISYGIIFYIAKRYYNNSKMVFLLIISIYSMILYVTDNVSIYILYTIPLYCIIFAVLTDESDSQKGKNSIIKKINFHRIVNEKAK